jgi:hypothetical protein
MVHYERVRLGEIETARFDVFFEGEEQGLKEGRKAGGKKEEPPQKRRLFVKSKDRTAQGGRPKIFGVKTPYSTTTNLHILSSARRT